MLELFIRRRRPKLAFWKENDMKRFGVLLALAALGAAVAASGLGCPASSKATTPDPFQFHS